MKTEGAEPPWVPGVVYSKGTGEILSSLFCLLARNLAPPLLRQSDNLSDGLLLSWDTFEPRAQMALFKYISFLKTS